MNPPFYQRHEWGARYGAGAPMMGVPDLVVIHHTATPVPVGMKLAEQAALIRSIEAFHVEKNGWAGIGYNLIVTQEGRVFEGRGWTRVGAHTKGQNSRSIGVAVLMDATHDKPTPAALETIRYLLGVGRPRVAGHRDFAATECPGDLLYAEIEALRAALRVDVSRETSKGEG